MKRKNEELTTEYMFGKMPVWKAIIRNGFPAMIGMAMVLIYNLADTFFIGQTGNPYMVAAVSLCTPVFLLFLAFSTIFGIGGTSVIARALGEGRRVYAGKVASFCMWMCVAEGVILGGIFLLFGEPILRAIGASDDTIGYALTYLRIVSVGGVFMAINNCFTNILRAEGQPNRSMIGQTMGNALNIVLDGLFILVFHWDVVGAAAATAIGNFAGAMFFIVYYLSGKSELGVSIRNFTFGEKVFSSVFAIGFPGALASLLMSLSQIVTNNLMAGYDDMALAGMGVAHRVCMITGMLCMGLAMGVQPLLGFCVGARLWDRFKAALRGSILIAFGLGSLLTILCYLFTKQLVGAFLTDPAAYEYAFRFVRIMLSTGFVIGTFFVLLHTIQAVGVAIPALIVNLSRQGLVYIPVLFVLRAAFGVYGLAWAQPAADVVALILSIVFCAVAVKRVRARQE